MDRLHLRRLRLRRQLASTVIHFDYDCFYASVFEHESPHLKTLPLAVQQKQIVVTCNYEARRRGLYKLQLITEAKKICPDVVIVLGEDLTRFRDVSKELYTFIRSFSWNSQCERLGFDEVFMDVSDIVAYNADLLTPHDLANSFFCLSRGDPTCGFSFDATTLAGHAYPEAPNDTIDSAVLNPLQQRLILASHLAQYLRRRLEVEKGYTATVGIATNKLLAKLVGNQHKPNAQTTLLPPYTSHSDTVKDNVTTFIDAHEIGKIPGLGFKTAQKLRAHVLNRPADIDTGLVYGGTKENILVSDVRNHPGMGPETLDRILSGPGVPQGIGARVWDLINGCDDIPVGQARDVPTQISIEDSYIRLASLDQVIMELHVLGLSLLKRMYADLLEHDDDNKPVDGFPSMRPARWKALPKTIRLSTRPRPAPNPDGSRSRSFTRISKSAPMPNFVFGFKNDKETLVERLVQETLIPLFRRLHPEKNGWNLSLVNLAVANMVETASDKSGAGRDIAKMFRQQDDVLRHWKVQDDSEEIGPVQEEQDDTTANFDLQDAAVDRSPLQLTMNANGSEDFPTSSQASLTLGDVWEYEDEEMTDADSYHCNLCDAIMPLFAMGAHERWHGIKL